ncbi:MAG TPA: sugar phosphate isomerase/epimerase family protein [Acidimicrobiales bacterium]|nr:sugar phosphate isomerase/epimerase family protein [Acidimicrobiales bacterium]
MHDRVSVNPMALIGLEVHEEAATLAAIGARRVGIASRKLAAAGWGRGLAAYQDADLEIAYLVHGVFTPVDDGAGWAAESDLLVRSVEAAAEVGAPFVYLCSGPPGAMPWEAAVEALGGRLAPAVERARACGVELALENALSVRTDTSFFFSLRDTAAAARQLGIGVCADLYCCWIEPGLADTLRREIDLIRLVQVSDRDLRSVVQPDRRVPGDGDLPLERLLAEVLDVGYTGLIDLELLGPHIDTEGGAAAVSRGAAWIGSALDRRGAGTGG